MVPHEANAWDRWLCAAHRSPTACRARHRQRPSRRLVVWPVHYPDERAEGAFDCCSA